METMELVTTEVTTEEKLDILANLRQVYAELEKAFKAANADLIEQIETLEGQIKTDVLESGETVKDESLMAVWVNGKTTWDGTILKGLEAVYPEIGKAKKLGKPSVSFRKVAA